jgi:hypothetical protein
MSLLGYRKWSVAVFGIAGAVFLSWFGMLDTQAAALIGTVVTGYLGANVGQKVVSE